MDKEKDRGEVVLYQPNDTIRLEVKLEQETVWLTQQQIADLFCVKQPAVSKHLSNIFKEGELEKDSVHSILEYTASDGRYLLRRADVGCLRANLKTLKKAHDRFLIIDDAIYHVGASIKDLGKKWTAIMRMETLDPASLLSHLQASF